MKTEIGKRSKLDENRFGATDPCQARQIGLRRFLNGSQSNLNGVRWEYLANESQFASPTCSEGMAEVLEQLANQSSGEDGKEVWILVAPYGDHPYASRDAKGRIERRIQRFERADAESLANVFHRRGEWRQRLAGIGQMILRPLGLPVYIGHPDHPDFPEDTDSTSYGRVKDIRAGERGLEVRIKWSEKGKALVRNEEFDGLSVNWLSRPDPAMANANGRGPEVWRPVMLASIGLTNDPNIPGAILTPEMANRRSARAADQTNHPDKPNQTQTDMDLLEQTLLSARLLKPGELAAVEEEKRPAMLANRAQQLLERHGRAMMLANMAAENFAETVNAALSAEGSQLTLAGLAAAAGTDEATLRAILAGEQLPPEDINFAALAGALGLEESALIAPPMANEETEEKSEEEMANEEAAAEEKKAAEEEMANARKAAAGFCADQLVASGRISPAEKAATVQQLLKSKDMTAEFVSLANKAPKMRTVLSGSPVSASVHSRDAGLRDAVSLGNRRDAGGQLRALANRRMREKNESWGAAWRATLADPENAGLVNAMTGETES